MIPTRGSVSQTWSNAVNASNPCSLVTDSRARASRTDRSNSASSISTAYFARSPAIRASTSACGTSPIRTAIFSGSSGHVTGPISWRNERSSNIRSVMPSKWWPTRATLASRSRRRTAAAAMTSWTLRRPSGSSNSEVTSANSRSVRSSSAVSSGMPAMPELSITTSKPSCSSRRRIFCAFHTSTGCCVSRSARAGIMPLV